MPCSVRGSRSASPSAQPPPKHRLRPQPQAQPQGPWKRVAKSVAVLNNIDHAQQQAYERACAARTSHTSPADPASEHNEDRNKDKDMGKDKDKDAERASFAHTAMRILPPPLAQPVARAPPARSAAEVWLHALNEPTFASDAARAHTWGGPSASTSASASASAGGPRRWREPPAEAHAGRAVKRSRTGSTGGGCVVPSTRRGVPSAPAFSPNARAEVRQLTSRAGLLDSGNKITHSDVHARTQLYTTANHGHQENACGKDSMPVSRNWWLKARTTKLRAQAGDAVRAFSGTAWGVRRRCGLTGKWLVDGRLRGGGADVRFVPGCARIHHGVHGGHDAP